MDNQNPKKKSPFGRDDRSGGSFFKARRDRDAMNNNRHDSHSGEESDNRTERRYPSRSNRDNTGDRPAYNNERRQSGDNYKKPFAKDGHRSEHRNDDKPRYSSRDNDDKPRYSPRGNDEGKPRYSRGNDDKPRYSPRNNDDSKPRYSRGNDDKPRYSRDNDRQRGSQDRDKRYGRSDDRDNSYRPRTGSDRRKQTVAEQEMPAEMRLNRFIAMSGVCSRREADTLIQAGEVTVNGKIVDQLGAKVTPSDEVRLNGELLRGEKKVYIIMNKPKGYVTTVEDPHADRTVIDLLKGACKERVYPVGRLDKNTTGVLLLTNDGNLTKELTHPSYEKRKIYHVFLNKPCAEEHLEQMLNGIELEDGPVKADAISYVDNVDTEVGVELHSGRNRIVRRMFESFGYDVEKLDRVYFAGLTKMGLRRGFWRYLTPKEASMLKAGLYE